MKKRMLLGLALSTVVGLCAQSPIERDPQLELPGLVNQDNVVVLFQSDFDSGTYRIQEPGYYLLGEDIVFDPVPYEEAKRTDKPNTGWFAAITIEVDNVIVDLNTRTLDSSQNFVDNQLFKVYSNIELNNSPFPHLIFAFKGETEIKNARNTLIRNGVLGRSSHHGIHGNSNADVSIQNLTIRDFEVAAISLNGLKNGDISHISITGLEHPVPFTGLMALLNAARLDLENILESNPSDTVAHGHLIAIEAVIADNHLNGVDQVKDGLHDGNAYGIFINSEVDVGPVSSFHSEVTADCVKIEDVTVCEMASHIRETVGIADKSGKLLKGATFGVLRWVDVYPNGIFAPNEIVQAQVYAASVLTPPSANPDPEVNSQYTPEFVDAILNVNEAEFLQQVKPNFGHDFAGHTNKGVFGIRIDTTHGVKLDRCHVTGVTNVGPLGATYQSIPAGDAFEAEEIRYRGNDVHGISVAASHTAKLVDCSVLNCGSKHGFVFGVSETGHTTATKLSGVHSNCHWASWKNDNENAIVNPSSEVYGIFIDSSSDSNIHFDCHVNSLLAPAYVCGFCVVGGSGNIFRNCTSLNNQTTCEYDSVREQAIGFASLGGCCNVFHNSAASGNKLANGAATGSRAAGFLLDDGDKDSVIVKCKSGCNNGECGRSVGIMLGNDITGAVVRLNEICNNHTTEECGEGIGLAAVEGETNLIIQNTAYGHPDCNYAVSYANPTLSLPVRSGSYYNPPNLSTNHGDNISLNS